MNYALIQSSIRFGLPTSKPGAISADLPALREKLRDKLKETMDGCECPVSKDSASIILAHADAGEDGSYLYSTNDSFILLSNGAGFMGFTHIRRSMRGPDSDTWEIHPVPAWKIDPAPDTPEPLFAIHMHEQSLQGVYSNIPGGVQVVFIDEDRQYYDPNPDTDKKLERLGTLVCEELVHEVYYGREGTVEHMDAVLKSARS